MQFSLYGFTKVFVGRILLHAQWSAEMRNQWDSIWLFGTITSRTINILFTQSLRCLFIIVHGTPSNAHWGRIISQLAFDFFLYLYIYVISRFFVWRLAFFQKWKFSKISSYEITPYIKWVFRKYSIPMCNMQRRTALPSLHALLSDQNFQAI